MKHRIIVGIISIVLCFTLLFGTASFAFAAETGTRSYKRLADLDEITDTYLSDSEERTAQYPFGAIMIAETSAEFEMKQCYAIDILRQGGTKGEAKIKLSTVDMTAGYGEDYRLYLTDERSDKGVEGEKKLYYYESNVPYIARLSDHEEYYMTKEGVDDLDAAQKEASEINDMAADNMPHSTETVLSFADGENRKTIYIETMMKDKVADDLEFMLTLSEPENCSISASVSGIYRIKENRAKPKAELSIASTSVNPESDEAFVTITRSGNLGGYDSFRVTTKSDTAQAETDYTAVAEDLRFVPGVSEIKVPIALLDGAENGRQFSVELSDPSANADITADSATVTFDSDKEIAATGAESKKYVTGFTYKTSSYREYEFVDLSKFHREKCLGDWDDTTNKYESNKWRLDYDQWGWKNHATDAMSPSKVSFVGVKSIRFCYDNAGGSCQWDDGAVVLSETNPLDDGDRGCGWMSNLGQNGTSWGLGNTGPSHLDKTITPTSSDKYIYLVLHKAGFTGCSGVKFHDYNGDKDCSFRFDLQDYKVSIIDPEPVSLYKNGSLQNVKAVTNAQFTDPNSANANYTTSATFYRYDTTTIKAAVDSKYGAATLKGIYLCDPDNTSRHSSLITLSGGNFTFSPQIISGYSSYFRNNKVIIQPVYEFEKINFNVESYTDEKTGVAFTADNSAHTGVFTIDGSKYGTVSWSYDNNRNGDYYDGDELVFSFTPDQSGGSKTVAYEYRFADVKSDLGKAQWYKTGTAADKVNITLSHKYFSVSPYITDLTVKNRLIVKGSAHGGFTSKGTKYATDNGDGSVTVSGYYIKGDSNTDTIDEEFTKYAPGKRMEYSAQPDNGYYAEWSYVDAVTHEQKTYRGNIFYYTVQNPFHLNDNTVTLTFKQRSPSQSAYDLNMKASVYALDGTILHPATTSTEIKKPAANAVVYLDGYSGVTDENGSFVLTSSPGSDEPATAVPVVGTAKGGGSDSTSIDETHRALIRYNGNDYICDIRFNGESTHLDQLYSKEIILDSASTLGVVPTRAEAYSIDTGVYGDSITLVNARTVNFSVDFDARNISKDKPVNLARWSFVGENGMLRSSTDIPVAGDSSTALYSCIIMEKAKPGDHMFIEFYNKSFDSSSNAHYTPYGKYEVGYSFVSANIDKVMSYMPDIGFYDDEGPAETGADLAATGAPHYSNLPSAPAIGPISPLFSIYGFLPTYSDTATGQKDQKTGKDLYCLEIGVQLSVSRTDTADQKGSWGVASVAKQWEKLSKIITKSPGELCQNLQTSTKISITISFAYQLEYYTRDDGARCYTASVFLLGGKLGIRISIPFTVVAIPCFVYFDISADNVGYLVHTPNGRTDGYWTSSMLHNSYYYETHGEFSQDFKIQMGVGIGFDGLAAIGGHIDFGLVSRISGTNHGKMSCSVAGGVFAQLLFLKVDKTWNIKQKLLLDTEADLASVGANILNSEGFDLMEDTKLSDLTFAEAEDVYDDTVNSDKDIAATGAEGQAIFSHETYAENNTAQMAPVIGQISNDRYLIASVMNTDNESFALRYYIYNTSTKDIEDKGNPISEVIAGNGLALDDERVQELLSCNDLVGDVNVIDCDNKLLLVWESCTVNDYQSSSVDDALRAFKIAAIVYDKETKQFTDFGIINTESNSLPDRLRGIYNPSSGTVHIFYKSIDVSSVTDSTTMKQLNDLPISLNTCAVELQDTHPFFSKPEKLDIHGVTLTDYDVTGYENQVLVSVISADQNSLTVEKPLTSSEYNEESYGTKNRMYLDRYSEEQDRSLGINDSIMIADENLVTANPEFVKLRYKGDENTLLFFKCNGRYGYQNIENLYSQYEYEKWDGALLGDTMKPEYITDDEDHTVGEDFKVYAGSDGVLYALWTQSEGTQQQICGRQFQVYSVEEIDKAAVTDDNNNVQFDPNNTPVTEQLDKPIHILHGFWGNKAYLTTGGNKTGDFSTGLYKANFDAFVTDKDSILSVYNTFDYDFGEEEEGTKMKAINNRFVITEFDIASSYYLGSDYEDAIKVNNSLPTPGETIKINTKAVNSGFSNGRDVTLKLMRAGQQDPVATLNYPVWLAGEEKEAEFEYTVPKNDDLANEPTVFFYQIDENGERRFRSETTALTSASRLSIVLAHADPEQLITADNDTTCYHVTATVTNTGNAQYEGGDELDFIFNDMAAQADVMNPDVPNVDPFYINYGGIEIPEISVGSSVELSFVSDDIPERIFDKYGTNSANLRLAITPKDGIGWTEVKGNEPYNFIDELGIGQFVKPVPKEVREVSAEPVTVTVGSERFIMPKVTPPSAASEATFTYSTEDDSIVTVDGNGLVKGISPGTGVVTVSCGNVSTDVRIVVTTDSKLLGDADLNGEVDIADATTIQRHDARSITLVGTALQLADVDKDEDVTIIDATWIQRWEINMKAPEGIGKPI